MARTVALWAGPRNGSTALMYSFAQRSDTRVLDEPLFAHFLKHTGVGRPSRDEVLITMPSSKKEALATLVPETSDQVLFLKHMANHLEGLDWEDLDGPEYQHVILTRHPDGVLPSYRAHIDHPTLLDLGYAHQQRILKLAGERAAVVTAESLFANPTATLRALCDALDLPWQTEMLTWKKAGSWKTAFGPNTGTTAFTTAQAGRLEPCNTATRLRIWRTERPMLNITLPWNNTH